MSVLRPVNEGAAVPPERLYFAILDRPVSARGRARTEELGYAFEAAIPVPLASVHPVFRTLPDGRVMGIGIDRRLAASLGSDAARAHPAHWPIWLEGTAEGIDPRSVNLLDGPCRSPLVASARRSSAAHALLAVLVVAAIVSGGLERRIRAAQMDTAGAVAATESVYAASLGTPAAAGQPYAARMTSELRRLRATRQSSGEPRDELTADRVLAGLLSVWPDGTPARTEAITVAERTVDVVLRVDDLEAAQAFVTSLGRAPGLSPGPSKTDRDSDGIRLSLRFDREVSP